MVPNGAVVFINGQFRAAEQVEEVLEAATGERLGLGMSATEAEIDAAVRSARAALPAWRSTSVTERAAAINRFADALHDRAEAISELCSCENGMPIALSRRVNATYPEDLLRYYAEIAVEADEEEIRPSRIGHTLVRREPIGVVAAIAPWNYPQALAVMKIAPALAAGCTVVLKAAPETSLDAPILAQAALAAGLPPGVLNVLAGGASAGAHLVAHDGIDKVAFTGSTAAGRQIGEVCGRLLRPVTLELGGKSAAIICDDADLDATVAGLRVASFVNNGQTCYLSSRILAPRSRYAEVVDAVAALAENLVVGNPLDDATEIGPLVTSRQRDRVMRYIKLGKSEGARLVVGGSIPAGHPHGWYVAPTVFADVDNAFRIAQEEIFGPVLTVIPYDGDEDAIAIANDSEFGLAGSVWTSDVNRGTDIARRIHTGTVGVNNYLMDMRAPFGGVKASGIGRELGPEGLAAYQNLKSVYRYG